MSIAKTDARSINTLGQLKGLSNVVGVSYVVVVVAVAVAVAIVAVVAVAVIAVVAVVSRFVGLVSPSKKCSKTDMGRTGEH